MRRRKKRRPWEEGGEDDPGAGLLNLFDVWIAFAVALLLAIVSFKTVSAKNGQPAEGKDGAAVQPDAKTLERYRPSEETAGGDGERLGTAYRLKSGEVIYVPEGKH